MLHPKNIYMDIARKLISYKTGLSVEALSVRTGYSTTEIHEVLNYFESRGLVGKGGNNQFYVTEKGFQR